MIACFLDKRIYFQVKLTCRLQSSFIDVAYACLEHKNNFRVNRKIDHKFYAESKMKIVEIIN